MRWPARKQAPPLGAKLIPILAGRRWRSSDGRFAVARREKDSKYVVIDTAHLPHREIANSPSFAEIQKVVESYYR